MDYPRLPGSSKERKSRITEIYFPRINPARKWSFVVMKAENTDQLLDSMREQRRLVFSWDQGKRVCSPMEYGRCLPLF